MAYEALIAALKGGPTSGNWAHVGRPGKIGGSGPGGGHGAIGIHPGTPRDAVSSAIDVRRANRGKPKLHRHPIESYHNRYYVDMQLDTADLSLLTSTLQMTRFEAINFVGRTFSYKDKETGYFTDIASVEVVTGDDGVRKTKVVGNVRTEDGERIGEFERYIMPDKIVKHEFFTLKKGYQGEGFGSRFYQNAEESYVKAGLKAVRLDANIDVGGYAWARMGFDFAPVEVNYDYAVMEKLSLKYKARYGVDITNPPKTANGIAALTGPDGHRIGKEALMGTYWVGQKSLSPGSTGYKVGQAYYQSKGKK